MQNEATECDQATGSGEEPGGCGFASGFARCGVIATIAQRLGYPSANQSPPRSATAKMENEPTEWPEPVSRLRQIEAAG